LIEIILAFLVITGAAIFESAILSRLALIHGIADLYMLLIVAWTIQPYVKRPWIWWGVASLFSILTSATPFGVLPLAYLVVFVFAFFLRQRFWRARFLTMLALSVIGTFIVHSFSVIILALQGTFFSISDVLNLVTLPSMLVNLILSIPIYALTREMVGWLYPEKIEV